MGSERKAYDPKVTLKQVEYLQKPNFSKEKWSKICCLVVFDLVTLHLQNWNAYIRFCRSLAANTVFAIILPLCHLEMLFSFYREWLCPTWQVHGQTDERFVPVWGGVTGVGQKTHPVSLGTISGPHLAPVDHVLIPFLHRFGLDTWIDVWWSVEMDGVSVKFGKMSARTVAFIRGQCIKSGVKCKTLIH